MMKRKLPLVVIGVFLGGLLSPTTPASADARCEHFSHTDWHWADFHNDTHAYDGHRMINSGRYDAFYNATHNGQAWTRFCGH